ncbi:F-box/LRR-repeat protein 4-like isoform X2 [Lycium ferocissimum]|uniref:F-box/LRR-repeat protein 4-like isoform X2 n=1 Tax=Lycium ferocissimum TaxID=112874 RepID=UPI0028155A97|nr:F-box/LRR-repeat protein 4-like isoform X2 [Lycium ferocissimum]
MIDFALPKYPTRQIPLQILNSGFQRAFLSIVITFCSSMAPSIEESILCHTGITLISGHVCRCRRWGKEGKDMHAACPLFVASARQLAKALEVTLANDLGYTKRYVRCLQVGNKGIIAVGENCKFLTDLSLRFCDRIGDEALVAIGEGCSLHHLNVSGCHQIGDAGIIAIARGCPELSYLDVSVLQDLGDMAMMELGEGCLLLRDIVLSHCRQITNVGLRYLVNNCTLLETCHMVYCPGITASGVATVITSCKNIKKVLVEKWKVSSRTKRRAGSIISYLCVDL